MGFRTEYKGFEYAKRRTSTEHGFTFVADVWSVAVS